MKKLLNYFSLTEKAIWSFSVVAIVLSFVVFKSTQYVYLAGSLLGVTALIFVAKGNPFGQVLSIVFGIFYGIIAFSFKYYGEMITYIFLTIPLAIFSLLSWLKNPAHGSRVEVRVNTLGLKEYGLLGCGAFIVTVIFYFVLRYLRTENLLISTLSVFTTFIAAYLAMRRSKLFTLAYALSDIVLIVMWSLASVENISYIPLVICFFAFFVNDIYGYFNWTLLGKKQTKAINNESIDK